MSLRMLGGLLLVTMIVVPSIAAETPPGGVYAIINASTTGTVSAAQPIVRESLKNSGVDGLLIHLRWNAINPDHGTFAWAPLDAAIAILKHRPANLNKRFEIGIVTGGAMPLWITKPPFNAPSEEFFFNRAVGGGCTSFVMAAPYNAVYLNAFSELLHHLSVHLHKIGEYEHLGMLKLDGMTTTTDELRLPALDQCNMPREKTTIEKWRALGYKPKNIRKAWDTMLQAFLQYFPEKSFNIGYIAFNAFPGITNAGIPASDPKAASARLVTELIEDAGGAMPGHLALGFDSLVLNPKGSQSYAEYESAFFSDAAAGSARLGWQTNELYGDDLKTGGAACGGTTPANRTPCKSSAAFRAMLFAGIYPQGKASTPANMQGVYLELFPQNINCFPPAVSSAHANLASWNNTKPATAGTSTFPAPTSSGACDSSCPTSCE
jgi:hypothetical protein